MLPLLSKLSNHAHNVGRLKMTRITINNDMYNHFYFFFFNDYTLMKLIVRRM